MYILFNDAETEKHPANDSFKQMPESISKTDAKFFSAKKLIVQPEFAKEEIACAEAFGKYLNTLASPTPADAFPNTIESLRLMIDIESLASHRILHGQQKKR